MMRDLDGLNVDADIRIARTLPGWTYNDASWFERLASRVFPRAWTMFPLDATPSAPGDVHPWVLLPGLLDEPLLLARDDEQLRCLSNVCTHRGFVLIDRPSTRPVLRCGYHGRRFRLDGTVLSAPGFEHSPSFPSPCDHLSSVDVGRWRRLVFASLDPTVSFDVFFGPAAARLDAVVPQDMNFDADGSPHYDVRANWALYCDNYLEGFHIPYVHPGLNAAIEWSAYRTETFAHGSVQIAAAKANEPAFELPKSHPDHGQRIGAYYVWLFPTTMINVYPWGMSINIVLPKGPKYTTVVYRRYIWDPSKLGRGVGVGLDEVEMEDEAVVESCARGVRSRLYDRGRYAPDHERGVHHFHRLLTAAARAKN